LQLSEELNNRQVVGLAFAMLVIGGKSFENTSNFLKELHSDRRKIILL
jgi:hypothetical protein